VLTFKLTPNRADCLSVLGIAREVSALTGAKLKNPQIRKIKEQNKHRHAVKIRRRRRLRPLRGSRDRNVNAAAPTPEWMRRRLERAGQRPISALVDVTNYVMLELAARCTSTTRTSSRARSMCAGAARAKRCCC
jgi:phenylalanyl-tRNA synthetase beta chain